MTEAVRTAATPFLPLDFEIQASFLNSVIVTTIFNPKIIHDVFSRPLWNVCYQLSFCQLFVHLIRSLLCYIWKLCFALMYYYATRSTAAITSIDLTEDADFLLIFLYRSLLHLFEYQKRSFGLSFLPHRRNWQAAIKMTARTSAMQNKSTKH